MSLYVLQLDGKIEVVTDRAEHVLLHFPDGKADFTLSRCLQDVSYSPRRLYQIPDKPDSASVYLSIAGQAVQAVHFFRDDALRLLKRCPEMQISHFSRSNGGAFSRGDVFRQEARNDFHFLWEGNKRAPWPGQRREEHDQLVRDFLKAEEDELVRRTKEKNDAAETRRKKLVELVAAMSDSEVEAFLSSRGH